MKWPTMPLQKAPKGLLELFRLRDGGRQPTMFGDVVEPSADVKDFYAADLLTTTTGAPTVGALTNLTETLVLGVAARVRGLGGQLTVGAAAVTAGGFLEVGWFIPTQGQPSMSMGSMSFGVALPAQNIGYGVPLDIVLPAGSVIYSRAGGTAAGVDHSLLVMALIENYTGSQG